MSQISGALHFRAGGGVGEHIWRECNSEYNGLMAWPLGMGGGGGNSCIVTPKGRCGAQSSQMLLQRCASPVVRALARLKTETLNPQHITHCNIRKWLGIISSRCHKHSRIADGQGGLARLILTSDRNFSKMWSFTFSKLFKLFEALARNLTLETWKLTVQAAGMQTCKCLHACAWVMENSLMVRCHHESIANTCITSKCPLGQNVLGSSFHQVFGCAPTAA